MSDANDLNSLARYQPPQPLSKTPPTPPPTVVSANSDIQLSGTPIAPRPIVVQIVHTPCAQSPNPAERPSHYITQKSQGKAPQSLPNVQLPNVLALTMSLVIALLLVVGASMFSIALNSYANSVDRVDRSRPFIQVK